MEGLTRGLSEEGPCKLGKVLYSDSNDRFKCHGFI